ncbi:MAG: T9SS type A sorting domain-containing protein [Cytophaga sp.]|uniref:T9SS type A sorting domain-containing protein n=1 Tax=Cytophaga sp. TaxID=29535 RepID=UPI003F7E25EC
MNYYLNATAQKDSFIFKNIQVHAVGATSSNDLRFTGGSASQNQNNQNQYVHAHFNSNQAYVSVNASQNVVCTNASDITLNGSPGGGSYSVSPSTSALSGSTFKPSLSGAGLFVVTYTASQNGCTGLDTVHITVKPIPAVTFFGLASSYCSGDNDVPLTGFPTGGTFSGSGIVNTSFFRPSNAGVGNNKNVTYTYSSNGCTNTATMQTSVKQSPTVFITLNPDQNNYFSAQDSVIIGGTQNNPSSGGVITVSGNGVTSSGGLDLFHPNAVGQGNNIVITRTLTAPNGCATSATKTVSVAQSVGATINGLSAAYCKNSNDVTMTVNNDHGIFYAYFLLGGTPYYYTPQVIIDNNINDGSASFSPANAPYIGEYMIIFSGANGSATTTVEVTGAPALVSSNIDSVYCNSQPSFAIVASGSSGGNVSFSGSGINNNTFSPGAINLGSSNSLLTNISYTYTDVNNCKVSGNIGVRVKKTPTGLSILGLDPKNKYCDSINSYSLTGSPSGGYFKPGIGMGTGVNDTIFYPQDAAKNNNGVLTKDYKITYIYNDPQNGCQASVDSIVHVSTLPDVLMGGLNSKYCSSDPAIDILSNVVPSNGKLSIKSSDGSIAIAPGTLDNSGIFHPNVAVPGSYDISYKCINSATGCWNTATKTTIVNAIPNTSFTNLDTIYCKSNADIILYGSPVGGIYSSLTAPLTGAVFKPSVVGKHNITYTYTDKFGCTASMTKNTIVYGIPLSADNTKPQFKLSTVCEKDFITLSDLSSQLNTDNGANSFIKSCYWKIDNIVYSNTFKNDTTLQLTAGKHTFTYRLTTDKNCINATVDTVITIGSYPKTNFTWDKICNKENTKFYNTSSIVEGNITNVVWDFGDGKPKVDLNLPEYNGDTSHTFINALTDVPSTYSVILKATSDYNCIFSDTQKVFILPAQDITSSQPYSSDFEVNNGGWIADAPIENLSSWKLGIADKSAIKSNNNVWVTSLDGSFNPKEVSYVYSPCFTLKDITKPMIHLDIWSSMINNVAGANLQYAVDGTTWKTLGKRNESGVNWYNNTGNIVARPSGTDLDQNGWTDTNTVGWKNARHIFDKELGSSKNIRFRIAFAGTEETTDGFAFDNVWIGDRTRLILAEYFTNNSTSFTKVENAKLNDLVTDNLVNNEPKDIVKLEYHTAFPGPDQINARNIPDAGARALYYGVTQVPYSCIDGSYFRGSAFQIDTNTINTRALYDPAFTLTLEPVLVNNVVSGKVTVENKIKVKNNVTVYISVLERFVNGIVGANGESSYQWVHAKFLPDAAGTSFNFAAVGDSRTVNFSLPFGSNNIYNPEKIAVIAFVQDNVTKEIYQTAYKGLGATVSTGVFDPTETTSTVSLYPNPADNSTTVALNGKLSGKYNWMVVDEMGRVIDEGTLTDGADGFTINTSNYANGFYTLRLSNSNAGVKTQKFVVIH